MLINVKMPTIVGILTVMSMINTVMSMINTTPDSLKSGKNLYISAFYFSLEISCSAELGMKKVSNLAA